MLGSAGTLYQWFLGPAATTSRSFRGACRPCMEKAEREGSDGSIADAAKQKARSRGSGFLLDSDGAGDRSRTYDLRITNALLYQLSYTGNKEVKL